MPIYVYQCGTCRHKLEVLQKINDRPLKLCPECGAQSLRKMLTAAAFKLKGTGWYETDFKDKPAQKDKEKEKSSDGAAAESGGKNGDKKSTDAADKAKPATGDTAGAKTGNAAAAAD